LKNEEVVRDRVKYEHLRKIIWTPLSAKTSKNQGNLTFDQQKALCQLAQTLKIFCAIHNFVVPNTYVSQIENFLIGIHTTAECINLRLARIGWYHIRNYLNKSYNIPVQLRILWIFDHAATIHVSGSGAGPPIQKLLNNLLLAPVFASSLVVLINADDCILIYSIPVIIEAESIFIIAFVATCLVFRLDSYQFCQALGSMVTRTPTLANGGIAQAPPRTPINPALSIGYTLGQDCDFMVVHQCMQSSNTSADPMAGMKAAMENCFTRSHQEGGWRGQDDHHGGGGSGENRGEQGFQAILNQSCPDSTSAKNVQSCMDNLRSSMQQQLQNLGSRPRFGNPSSMKSQMCAKKASCMSQLSSTCQTQWTQIKSQLCTCTQNEISTKSATLEAQIQACSSSSSGTTAQPATAASSGKGWNKNRGGGRSMGQGKMGRGGEHGQGRSGDNGLQKMAEWFCNDPCANN
uniref:Uncharacterized protein n=1 Tax=Romanomermis culicivorax TaxID=13658 RepID=A0A915I2V9_ROMCU